MRSVVRYFSGSSIRFQLLNNYLSAEALCKKKKIKKGISKSRAQHVGVVESHFKLRENYSHAVPESPENAIGA